MPTSGRVREGSGAPLPRTQLKLITAHRILIAAGIAFFIFYALVQVRRYLILDVGTASLVQAVVAGAVAVGLAIYYRSLKSWGRR
jgi:hypothetical protein